MPPYLEVSELTFFMEECRRRDNDAERMVDNSEGDEEETQESGYVYSLPVAVEVVTCSTPPPEGSKSSLTKQNDKTPETLLKKYQ